MAPEVLDETIYRLQLDAFQFDEFKMADMYSVALVFWEMCRRCVVSSSGNNSDLDPKATPLIAADEYESPYYDVVPNDPSFDDMYDVVCVQNLRPEIPAKWKAEPSLKCLSQIMEECWHSNPLVRLTALRVKKSLMRIEH